jgi:hypothetical protein
MKKFIPEHKVQRMRNLVTKKFGDKTKVQVGYGKGSKEHKEGDVWEEAGKTWTIKNGITQTVTKLDKARNSAIMPLFCPKCNDKHLKGQLDKVFWKLYGECSKCRLSIETKLKASGKWKQYELETISANAMDMLKQAGEMAKDFIDSTNREGYVSETGRVEDWSKQNKEEISKIVNENLSKIKKTITSKLENMNNKQ